MAQPYVNLRIPDISPPIKYSPSRMILFGKQKAKIVVSGKGIIRINRRKIPVDAKSSIEYVVKLPPICIIEFHPSPYLIIDQLFIN